MEEVNKMIEERKEKAQPVEVKKEEKKPEVKLHDHTAKEPIEIDDFGKVELKIAKVIACEKVEKSKKLLKLTVKVGEEQRTVVSGIALHYTPEELVGKKLAMITNLKPCKLCGIVSEGMIVCAENDQGKLAFLTPEKDIEDGSQVFPHTGQFLFDAAVFLGVLVAEAEVLQFFLDFVQTESVSKRCIDV